MRTHAHASADRFNLVDCLHDYRYAVTIHGDDVLAHNNWEIGESWLQRYKCVLIPCIVLHDRPTERASRFFRFLVDPTTLNITNRWRRERGEAELHSSEYSSEQPIPV